jgi:hypothetical protein
MATPSRLVHIRDSREPPFSRRTLTIAVALVRLDLQTSQSEQHVSRKPDAGD